MTLRSFRTLIAVAVAAAALLALAPASGVARTRSRSCATQWTNQHGYAYLYKLSVSRTSCRTGTLVAAHHGHVRGWRCHTKRLASSSVQYMDRESCASGRRRVSWEFTQNR